MKFKTKVKIVILCILAVTLCVCCAGCIGEMTAWDFLKGQNANQAITYYANGGKFGQLGSEGTSKDTVDIYYKENVSVISDDFTCTGEKDYYLNRPGYTFLGWYAAKTDADGNPLYLCYDKDGNLVDADSDKVEKKVLQISDTPADTSPIKKDEHRYFCAAWSQNAYLLVKLVSDEAVTLSKPLTVNGETFEADHTINPGDYIASAIFTTSGNESSVTLSAITTAECKGHTFLQYYLDEECTTPISRYIRGEDEQEGENSTIYAKYITGKYTIVKDAGDVANMFLNLDSGNSYYFFNTTKNEIDMIGRSVSLKNTTECNVKIYGNGFTIKNLTYGSELVPFSVTNGSTYSMFGKLTADASISDLTLQNTTMTVTARSGITATFHAITREVADGAAFTGFAIDGITLKIKIPASSTITNIPVTDGVYATNSWLFGGGDSDEDIMQRFTGISVNGAVIEVTK